ncbi:copper resistance CopC family protein [Micromonospora sp. CV4]|uniref:copper resistance CopC family protein n=1 Tax=Micromonospora sp. CV4 TaxID=2478711 RepID=UPI000EF4D7F3|nr:copper resistance CopC family protein [Micromonospora sp. CV4]RLP85369.1 copper resistance protein CopC [Micromonospora sp. CV4]
MKRSVAAPATGKSATGRAPRTRRTVGLIVTVVLAAGLSPTVTPAPAFAHGARYSITPADGAALVTAPERVEVAFAADITSDSSITIVDHTGTNWSHGRPAVHGARLIHQVKAGMPDGGYEISWRATFTDGHPVTGTAEFTVGADTAAAAAANPLRARLTHDGVVAFYAAAGVVVLALLLAIMTLSRGVYAGTRRAAAGEKSTL